MITGILEAANAFGANYRGVPANIGTTELPIIASRIGLASARHKFKGPS